MCVDTDPSILTEFTRVTPAPTTGDPSTLVRTVAYLAEEIFIVLIV
tara:strand:- start:700 stop:837 length:138 start_codon:yes stop_codon:yes gene_type:complete